MNGPETVGNNAAPLPLTVTSGDAMRDAVSALVRSSDNQTAMAVLFAGDRLRVCDEAIVAGDPEAPAGIATLSASGEYGNDEPALVGMYVRPEHRGRGVGLSLLGRAVLRARERSFSSLRIDALSEGMLRLVDNLPAEDKDYCCVYRVGMDLGYMLY